ncbi:hypothetical protein ONZ51_g9011 [Trametes cubensis]|uniref:Mitochondrial carrier n=1 Tax=Trametes cubensis TaxID=1111947 RepID=A0AAD7TM72_9APHY|nr:hypothetical protein ONZ51_g9011 [Trametes cubensis]
MSIAATPSRPLSTIEGFVCGGMAACVAVTVSNPAEVAKTRMQLQGELAKKGGEKVYKNALDVIAKTWRNEGIRGVQRGLGPAYVYQILMNGSRLGFYEPIRRQCNKLIGADPTDQIPFTSVFSGAASGIIGGQMAFVDASSAWAHTRTSSTASLGNPFFLIKARMQAYSPVLPVGAQHYYKSSFDALRSIWHAEKLRGLVQLPTYNWTKNQLVSRGISRADSIWTFLASSSVSGLCVLTMMQPTDTVLTRMYNQPTIRTPDGRHVGALYKNPIDCLWKTLKAEGPLGWYKGSTAHFLRIVPHTIVTLTANDIIVGLYKRIRDGHL